MSIDRTFRESAHVHSVVIDKSQIQTSGGGGVVDGRKSNIAPPRPPKPPAPEPVHKVFKSLIFPITNAPIDISSDSWDYSGYIIQNAYLEIEFVDWGSLSLEEREQVLDHIASSNIVIRETETSGVYNLSIYLLEYVDDTNAYILYDYSTDIIIGSDTSTSYGIPRDGEVIPVPILVRVTTQSGISSNYRPILSASNVYDPETDTPLYDVSSGFNPREPLPEKSFRDYFTKVLCRSYPLLQLRSSADLSYVFPNNGYLPDFISGGVQGLSDLVLAVYYPVPNDGYPYYRKSEGWSITNRTITIPETDSYSGSILVIDPNKAQLVPMSGSLNLLLMGGSGSAGDMMNTELDLFGGCPGTGSPFDIKSNSYTDIVTSPDTYFVGEHSMMPFLNGSPTQIWSIKEFSYPYIAYVNYYRALHEEDPYPHLDGYLYTSASPQGFDTQSDIQISSWVSKVPWGSRAIRSQMFTMTTDFLPYDLSPLTPEVRNPVVKESYIELSFLQWSDESSKNNLIEVFRNCYLSIIRVSETGYVLLIQPGQSLTRDSISDSSACVLSIYIDSNMEAPLPEDIDNYYPIETRHTSFTTLYTRMCTNQGSSSSASTQIIVVKFIIDGVENMNPDFCPVVPPYVEGESISFSNELNISFLQ